MDPYDTRVVCFETPQEAQVMQFVAFLVSAQVYPMPILPPQALSVASLVTDHQTGYNP